MSTTSGEHTTMPVAVERKPEIGTSVLQRARDEIATSYNPVFHAAVDNLAKGAPTVETALGNAMRYANQSDCFIGQCSVAAKGTLSDLFPKNAKGNQKGWSIFS